MRTAFIQALNELADNDDRVCLIVGDLGYSVIEDFANRHPDQFVNAGVSEQNMIGLSTGLAEAGFRPFAYSIATFATMRPYEFIRNGPVHQRLPVSIDLENGTDSYSRKYDSSKGVPLRTGRIIFLPI